MADKNFKERFPSVTMWDMFCQGPQLFMLLRQSLLTKCGRSELLYPIKENTQKMLKNE